MWLNENDSSMLSELQITCEIYCVFSSSLLNIGKVSGLGFDGGLFHIFAELSSVCSHALKELSAIAKNASNTIQTPLPAIPLNAVCPLLVDFCHHKNFFFLMMNLRLKRQKTKSNTAVTARNVLRIIICKKWGLKRSISCGG